MLVLKCNGGRFDGQYLRRYSNCGIKFFRNVSRLADATFYKTLERAERDMKRLGAISYRVKEYYRIKVYVPLRSIDISILEVKEIEVKRIVNDLPLDKEVEAGWSSVFAPIT
jgi:hypothetical protein